MSERVPLSSLDRLKAALRIEAERLQRGQASFPTLAGGFDTNRTIEGWRTILYLQLLASRPGFDPREAATLSVMLSRDVAFTDYDPAELAVAACRLLEGSPATGFAARR